MTYPRDGYGRDDRYDRRDQGYQQPRQELGYRDRGHQQEPEYRQPPQQDYQPRYDQRQYPSPPPKKRRSGLYVALGVAAVVLVGCVAAVASSGGSGSPGATATSGTGGGAAAQGLFQHPEDIVISKCEPDEFGLMAAQIVITNSSGKASNYSVQVSFQSPDGKQQFGDGYATIMTLAAGQQRPEQVQAFKASPGGGAFKCAVVSAQRTQAL